MTKAQVETAARDLITADSGCPQVLLDSMGVAIILTRPGEGRRQRPSISFHIICFGAGVAIACSEQHFQWAEDNLSSLSRDEMFSPKWMQTIASRIESEQPGWEFTGPRYSFLCARETMALEPSREGAEVRIFTPDRFGELEKYAKELPNILSGNGDKAASAAFRSGELVSAAGASEDAPGMWQIGVDTLGRYRRHGAAKLVVWHLTKYAMDHNATPFYTTTLANLPSQRVARAVGYWPAWLEAFARPAVGDVTVR